MSSPVLQLAPDDNVVVAMRKLVPGEAVTVGELVITVKDAIPFAHKLAVRDLEAGAKVTQVRRADRQHHGSHRPGCARPRPQPEERLHR